MVPRGFLLCLAVLGASAHADDARQQRARIAAERAEVNAAYAARDAECRQRFVVTSCVNEARRQQRDALDRLHRQQLLLDEGQRRERAAQRVEAIRGKSQAADGGPRKPPAPPEAVLHLRQATPAKAAASHPPRAAASPSPKAAPARSSEAHAEAAEQARQIRRRDLRGKQAEIQSHREAVAKRDAQRAASGKKPSAPLPLPPAGSTPR